MEYSMWYVIQVRTGTEESIRIQCEKKIPKSVMERCFIPYYEEKRKIRGSWTTIQKVLFPGYVFIVSQKIEDLYVHLKHIMGFTKLIGSGNEIVPLTQKEKKFLLSLGGEEQVVTMSEGIIEGKQVKVLEGPLAGREGMIRRIDRHKRKAWMEVDMFGRKQLVQVGLEIVGKI